MPGRALHVAFFNRSFHPDTTATGQLLTELCETLVHDHGCRVSVVAGTAGGGGSILRRERYRGIEVLRARGTRFPKRRFVGRAMNYVTYFFSACYAGLRLDRPDVVVALTDPPIIGLAAWLAACRFRAPLVMSFRDIFPEVARLLDDFHSGAVERVLEAVNRFLVRQASINVTLGDTMRRRLIEGKGAPAPKTVVIPDWTDCTAITPGEKVNGFSVAHGLTRKFVVMHSGNIGLSQSLETVLESAALLRDLADIVFVFVGDGVKRPALERLVQHRGLSNVLFLPYQPKAALTQSFATADVFIVSLEAGLSGYIVPSKLYGILAAGRPYIAAIEDDSEAVTIARRYECGLVSTPGKPQELADRIAELYHDRALAQRLGANARRAALAFDRADHVRAYHELFLEVCGRRDPAESRVA